MTNMIQHIIQELFLQNRNKPYDKSDIAQNTRTIPVEQKQHYDKYDIAQNTGTIHVEQKQHYDKYDIAQNIRNRSCRTETTL